VKKSFLNNSQAMKFGFRREEAAEAVGSRQLLDDMERANWLKPVVNRHKLVIFDRGDIQRAWARILAGELPPVRVRKGQPRSQLTAGAAGASHKMRLVQKADQN
jgi:hypothetical protein